MWAVALAALVPGVALDAGAYGVQQISAQTDTNGPSVPAPPVPPGAQRRVDGRVIHPTGPALLPVAGRWVTLHRVGSDTAGPLDSMRTRPDGHYGFRYRTSGSPDAVYFVSVSYDGIAYLSRPLGGAHVESPEADITVYDTTTHPVPLRVQGRHLVVSAPAPSGLRSVVEVFELSNDSSVTLVSSGGQGAGAVDRPTWSIMLPVGAERFQVGQGDVAPDAVTLAGNRVEVFAPFAPGLKQLSFSYVLPPSAFPLARPIPTGAVVLETLLEEPGARVEAPRVREKAPVAVEGRTFRRYLSQDVPARSAARVTVPVVYMNRRGLYIAIIVIILGVGMLTGLALAFRRGPMPSSLASTGRAP